MCWDCGLDCNGAQMCSCWSAPCFYQGLLPGPGVDRVTRMPQTPKIGWLKKGNQPSRPYRCGLSLQFTCFHKGLTHPVASLCGIFQTLGVLKGKWAQKILNCTSCRNIVFPFPHRQLLFPCEGICWRCRLMANSSNNFYSSPHLGLEHKEKSLIQYVRYLLDATLYYLSNIYSLILPQNISFQWII